MSDKPKVTELHRLSQESYDALEKQLPAVPFVTADTTSHQAGFLLGVQMVLAKLRTGYVVG